GARNKRNSKPMKGSVLQFAKGVNSWIRLTPSGTWMVWDEVDNAPASLGGCSLVGRTWQRAKVACDLLKRIYDNRLEARSQRESRWPSRWTESTTSYHPSARAAVLQVCLKAGGEFH
ncbi:hypothetical protein NKJ14_33845, partial [Mesorhizobium sp. M0199]